MRATTAAILFVSMCSACGGDDGGGTGPVTLDELPDAYGGLLCDRFAECSLFASLILTQTSCESLSYDLRNGTVPQIEQGIEDGTIVYDAEAMGRCLEAMATASCEDLSLEQLGDLEACRDAIVGQQGDGDACDADLQCAYGLYCDTNAACPGACAPRVELDGDCTNGATCAAGLTCDSNSVCSPFQTAGDDCTTFECALGYACSDATSTCVAMTHAAGEGATCDPNEGVMCAGDLTCTAEAVDAFVCRARGDVGATCYVGVPNPCVADVVCSSTDAGVAGTCEALPEAGDPCRTGGSLFDRTCAGDAACDDASGNCVAHVDNGGACTVDAECANACAVTCQAPVACQ